MRTAALLLTLSLAAGALAQDVAKPPPPSAGEKIADARASEAREAARKEARELTARGAKYLVAAQEADGGWFSKAGPGVTALALRALILEPTVGPKHPAVRRGIDFVLKSQRDDGGVYAADGGHKNYESSVVLSMFAALKPEDYPERAKQIENLRGFLTKLQWDEGEDTPRDNAWYGGAGYGSGQRPDLSNTQLMLEALHDSGLPKDDPAYQKALVFIGRCQMLGETNDQEFAHGSTQGGFVYAPAKGGESKAETIEIDGRKELRCYGSMTYAGFKSMIYAGLSKDDPRVKAALDWIRRYWTLDHNPNMPEKRSHEGLFYYYHTFARALAAWGQDVVVGADGKEHNWRAELVQKLGKLQRPDGSWVNEADRWMEGIPALTTAYAMLALHAVNGE